MLNSMRAKMTFFLALSLALFILLLSALYLTYARGNLERNFAASLDQMATSSAKLAREGAALNQLKAQIAEHNNQVTQSGAISEGVEAWLIDAQGQELWRSGPPRSRRMHGDMGNDKAKGGFHHQGEGSGRDSGMRPDRLVKPGEGGGAGARNEGTITRRIPPLDDPQEWRTRTLKWADHTLVLGLPWHRARRDLGAQTAALGVLSLLIAGAAAFGAWILVGKTLRPIDALAEQAQEAARHPVQLVKGHSPLLPTSSDSEIQKLVATLNQMLDNVSEAALSKERFHTSASHELRTPLQALGGHLGVTLARERSAAEYKEALHEAALQTARLSKLTSDLLLLNRLQTAASLPQRETVDVSEMCDIALQRAQKAIEARSLQLVEKWEALEIEATPSHVEILLGNLLENAAKYAHQSGKIGVEIEALGRNLLVWNECDESQLRALHGEIARLSEPFYRPDSARASETGGNGLGLAICHTIAEANGWHLQIELGEERFQVRVIFSESREKQGLEDASKTSGV